MQFKFTEIQTIEFSEVLNVEIYEGNESVRFDVPFSLGVDDDEHFQEGVEDFLPHRNAHLLVTKSHEQYQELFKLCVTCLLKTL